MLHLTHFARFAVVTIVAEAELSPLRTKQLQEIVPRAFLQGCGNRAGPFMPMGRLRRHGCLSGKCRGKEQIDVFCLMDALQNLHTCSISLGPRLQCFEYLNGPKRSFFVAVNAERPGNLGKLAVVGLLSFFYWANSAMSRFRRYCSADIMPSLGKNVFQIAPMPFC